MCFLFFIYPTSPCLFLRPHLFILCSRNGIFGSWRKTSQSVISESVLMWFQMIYQMVVSCGAETVGQIKTRAVWIAGPLSLSTGIEEWAGWQRSHKSPTKWGCQLNILPIRWIRDSQENKQGERPSAPVKCCNDRASAAVPKGAPSRWQTHTQLLCCAANPLLSLSLCPYIYI